MNELNLTLRSLRKSPAFTLTIILLIAIGIAASTTAFTLVHTLFFKPRIGVTDAASLYNLHPANKEGTDFGAWSWPHYLRLRSDSRQFSAVTAFTGLVTGLAHEGRSTSVETQLVSANFFDVIGTRPALGRFFLPAEELTPGAHPVAVISHHLWQTEFGGRSDILGTTLSLNGEPFTVVGVAPEGFHGTFLGFDFHVWIPLSMARVINAEGDLALPNADWLELTGRLASTASQAGAQAEVQALAVTYRADRAADERALRAMVLPNRPIDDDLRGSALSLAGALAIVAGLVLVIACLNVSGLLLTRAEERRRESAVRLALGAGRGRLIRQWLQESLLLFALGGLGGLLLAMWATDLALFRSPTPFIPLRFDFTLDWRAFTFCFSAALTAGLLTGLVPALRASRTDVVNDLKRGGHGATGSSRLRNTFVVAQLALALVPLVAAGLFARTLAHTSRMNPGFDPEQLLVTPLNLAQLGDTDRRGPIAAARLLEAAKSLPGVGSATLANRLPLGVGGLSTVVQVENPATPMPKSGFPTDLTFGDPSYFETLRIPLLAGRGFTDADRAGAPAVAVVSEVFARQLFDTTEVIGREFKRGRTAIRIVGVARNVSYRRLWETARPQFYLPLAQNPRARLVLAVRTTAPAESLVQPLLAQLQAAQPDLPLAPALPGSEQINFTLFPQRLGAQIAAVLGGVCLLLAAIGLYGVLTLGAVRQTREYGLRAALGAQRSDLVALIARRVVGLVLLGSLLGGGLAFTLTRLLQGFLHGIAAFDLATYGAVVLALSLVSLLAAWLPARRAAQVDPMIALRAE